MVALGITSMPTEHQELTNFLCILAQMQHPVLCVLGGLQYYWLAVFGIPNCHITLYRGI